MVPSTILSIVCAAAIAVPSAAFAVETSADARAEAGERFQHGVSLYENGNLNSALAEFVRAYELMPHPTVLYNIGLTYADLDKPVEATKALEDLVAAPGSLSGERLKRAQDTLQQQRAKVGAVEVTCSVDGAQIEVDGVVVGTAPLKAPLKLTTGLHVIGAIAPGHAPNRKSVTIASMSSSKLALDPPVLDARLAHLTVHTTLPGASLYVDGELTAKTPLPATLALLPGGHDFTLRREGYRDAKTSLVLGEGVTGEITLECEEDAIFTENHGGDLELRMTETLASVSIDGVSRGLYTGPLRLAPGPHQLLVERAGFRPLSREVTVESGKTKKIDLDLEPTPEWRATYVEQATTRRTASIVTLIAGTVVTVASTGFLVWNNAQNIPSKQSEFDTLADKCVAGNEKPDVCQTLTRKSDDVNQALTLNVAGGIGVTIGAIAAGAGIILLATGPNPHRYESGPAEKLAIQPVFGPTKDGAYFGMIGQF